MITACPDGEGAWYYDTAGRDLEEAKNLKQEQKRSFSWEQALKFSADVMRCSEPLTLVDIGGRIDCKNEAICHSATHAIVLYKSKEDLEEWKGFCHKLEIKILAEILSVWEEDCVPNASYIHQGEVFMGCLKKLERGKPNPANGAVISELADFIVKFL